MLKSHRSRSSTALWAAGLAQWAAGLARSHWGFRSALRAGLGWPPPASSRDWLLGRRPGRASPWAAGCSQCGSRTPRGHIPNLHKQTQNFFSHKTLSQQLPPHSMAEWQVFVATCHVHGMFSTHTHIHVYMHTHACTYLQISGMMHKKLSMILASVEKD